MYSQLIKFDWLKREEWEKKKVIFIIIRYVKVCKEKRERERKIEQQNSFYFIKGIFLWEIEKYVFIFVCLVLLLAISSIFYLFHIFKNVFYSSSCLVMITR